jgi:uncharacterized phage protein (TIGR01671 family)
MKRDILFRGKSPKGHWIYGMPSYDLKYIFNDSNYDSHDQFEVIPETVGQFTGLTDKNWVKVFEGDIVRVKWFDGEEYQFTNYEIYYNEEQLCYFLRGNDLNWQYFYELEVIGNIHDNPEFIQS